MIVSAVLSVVLRRLCGCAYGLIHHRACAMCLYRCLVLQCRLEHCMVHLRCNVPPTLLKFIDDLQVDSKE